MISYYANTKNYLSPSYPGSRPIEVSKEGSPAAGPSLLFSCDSSVVEVYKVQYIRGRGGGGEGKKVTWGTSDPP